MVESLAAFYNNLFAVEITAFGIIAAVILVFMQLFHSQFSYRQVSIIFRNIFFIVVFLTSVVAIAGTGMASVLLALPSHDFVPKMNFHTREIFLNDLAPVTLLVLFFLAMILFLVWIVVNLKYLKPANTLLLVAKRINQKDITEFVLKKYGVTRPQPRFKIKGKRDHLQLSIQIQTEDVEDRVKKRHEQITKKVANATDPFDMLVPIVVTALKDSDLTTVDNFCDVLVRISDRFSGSFSKVDKKTEEWDPYADLMEKYLQYITDYIQIFLDLSEKHQFAIGKLKFLQASERIAKKIVHHNDWSDLKILLEFWKSVGDTSIGRSREVFIAIVNNYKAMADCAFESDQVDGNESLNDIFRHLGWLGERLLGKEGIEDKPLMHSNHTSNAFDELMGTLLSYEGKYTDKYPNLYPLIYFDAMEVIFLRLLELYNDSGRRLKEDIFNCLFVYYSFGKSAISVQNEDGAALATFKLELCYKKSLERNTFDIGGEIADLLVRLGGRVAANNKKIGSKSFLNQPLEDYIIICLSNKIPGFNYQKEWEKVVLDVILVGEGNHDARWNFIKKLGKTLQTNFGMNFDWHTGKSLTENK
jgi:hypothetical protein